MCIKIISKINLFNRDPTKITKMDIICSYFFILSFFFVIIFSKKTYSSFSYIMFKFRNNNDYCSIYWHYIWFFSNFI